MTPLEVTCRRCWAGSGDRCWSGSRRRDPHKERIAHAAEVESVGPWWRSDGRFITEVDRDGVRLIFDSANVLMPQRGMRLRVLNYATARPLVELESFDRTTELFALTVAPS